MKMQNRVSAINTLNKNNHPFLKTMLFLFLMNSCFVFAQNPYIKTTSGIGQYGYLEKDVSTTMVLNSNAQGNIYQLFGRTYLNGANLLTYGTAVNVCGFTTNVDQTTSNYNFGANAIPGLIAYTSVHADYCDLTNSYGSNPNQTGYLERQHSIFDISDRPSDVTSNVIQLNPGAITSTNNVVMSVKIDFGTDSTRKLQRFWIQNQGTLAENSEIANDGFTLYYEPATGSEVFDGNESPAIIYGNYNGDATNNNIYGHDALNIPIPSGGLRVYVVLNKFASCVAAAKTVQVSLINDGLNFSPPMDTSYTLARVGQTPAAPVLLNVSYANITSGPLGGTYYIPSACFPTVASAVTALNNNGINAAVTFNVLAGYSETAPSGGFTLLGSGAAGNLATGTAANTITFKKLGIAANPLITASAAHTASSTVDGIFKIVGGDYITLDGFSMIENSANVATTAMTEFGVALFYATTTNGAQNNTIKNCSITLNKTNTNTYGIYSNTMHSSTSGTVSAAITNITGANSNNKLYSNTISNTNIGIVMNGTPGFENSGTDIGGASLATGNTITDQGNTSPATGFLGMPGTASYGILVGNSTGSNISYNTITGNAASNNSYGIYLRSSGSSPTTTHTTTISYNTLQVSSSATGTSYNLVGILNDIGGTNHTLNITNNTIQNATTTSTSFGGGFGGIWSKGAVNTIAINNNIISNNAIKGSTLDSTTANRTAFIKITNIPTVAITVSGNTINTNSFTNSGGGDIVAFDINGNFTSTCSVSNNTMDGLTAGGTSSVYSFIFNSSPGATTLSNNTFKNISNSGSGSFYGYYNIGNPGALTISGNTFQDISLAGIGSLTGYTSSGSPSGGVTISGNTFKNISNSVCSSGSWIRFVNSNTTTSQVININSNIIDNLTLNPATTNAGVTAIYTSITNNVSVYNNSIKNITSAGANLGIYTSGGSGPHNVYGNTIDGMTSSAAGSLINHYGLYVSPTSGISNIYSNKVYNISSGTSTNATIYGIAGGNGTTCNLYNNMVGDLKMPSVTNSTATALRGLSMSPGTNSIYNNTVYLNATSTGADFSSTALTYSGTGSIDLRNNILVNNSTPNGVGYAAAIMKTAAGTNGTVPTPYGASSNNNCLYAPSVTNGVIYVEGQYTGSGPTNVYPANCTDINAFKTFVSTRESNSFSEMPPFISTTTGAMDLHLNSAASSGCFDGGTTVAVASPDIDGNTRAIGAAYEIGADEANGTNSDKTPPQITYTPISDVGCSSTTTLTATITDANAIGSGANAPRLYYKKLSDATTTIATLNNNSVSGWKYVVATGTYSFTLNYALLPGGLVQGDVIQYFVAAQDISGNVATTSATVTPCVTSVVFTSAQTVSSPPTINQFTYRANLSGPYTVGTGSGQNYPTLSGTGGLFEAINNGYVTGDITATVTSNTIETGVVSLNEWTEYNSGTCALTGTTVYRLTVQSDGTVRTLEGTNLVYNATSLKAMINLNGADRVTFTGGTTTQRNLVFRTTNTAATSCVPVFQMGNVNGSNDIIIRNCDIQTNGTSGASPISAGIYITNVGTNANNLFQLNDIHDAVSGTTGNPRYGVFAENNTATVLQIKDNNIYNIYSKAIQLGVSSIGSGQTVTGNSIYSTGAGTTITSYSGIEINASTSSSGHTISNNYIGGTSANGGTSGTKWTNSTITTFRGIYIATNGTASTTTIANNVIGNLNLSNTTAVAFSGIDFTGKVDCNNNTIGHATDSAMGISIGAATATAVSNNYGIIGGTGTAVSGISFSNNKVKFITHNTSNTGVSRLFGIYNYYTGAAGVTITMSGNTVSDLTSTMKGLGNLYTVGSANSLALVLGILSGTASSSSIDISDNIIYNLSNTGVNGTNQPGVLGIGVDGNTTNTLYRNKIYSLSNQSPGSAANSGTIMGIRIQPSTTTIANNMITIINGSNTNASRIVGVWDNANSMTMHFNSIIIGGSQSAGGSTGICSAAYSCLISATSRSFLNNILINTRTGGTGGSTTSYHYALAIPTTVSSFTSNYNDLVAGDLTKLCLYNTTSYAIAGWRGLGTPSTPDLNSIAITPTFIDSANGDLHIVTDSNCALDNKGTAVAITSDFDVPLITRDSPPDIGADEFTNNFKLTITDPSALKCTVANVDLTASAITTGGAGSTTGATLTYWTDSGATATLASPASVSTEGTYYIKSVKGSCTVIKPVIVLKQGTTWIGGAWVGSGYPNGTLPDIETAVVIDDTYDTAVNGSFEACSLTVNSPSTLATACTLTIKPGGTDDGYITIQNDLTVNTNGTLVIENKGSLIMNSDTGVVTNNGTTQVKRTTTPFERYDYVYWSSPLNDTRTLSSIFSGWRTDYSFTFKTQNFADVSPVDTFDDNGDAWLYAGPSATMTKAKGYAVMTPTSAAFSPSALPVTVTFTGAANNGVIPIKEYESANTASTTDDYNLIGNPYPSAIWANKFIIDNGAKTSGTLYFWTHVADVSISNPGPGVYNFITADYALYNLSGGTASGTGSTIPTGYIGSGQGFFVEAQNDNVDLVFNNSMRKRNTGYTNNDFFRTSNSDTQRDRLWLNLQNPDGLFSQLLVGYFEQTTLGFDWAYDGRVNASNTQVSFYSLAENEKYKIQARPSFSDTDVVPLGYFSIANGQFTISLGQKEGVFETNQNIYIEDRDLHIIHDLKQSPYTFTTTYGRFEDRFILRYTDSTLSNPDLGNLDNTVQVASNHGQITIKSSIENIKEVTFFDILGRHLFEAKSIGNKDFVTTNISMSQQALIVKIKLENGTIVTRKIVL